MDTVAVDVSGVSSRVGHWDGERLTLEWLPGAFDASTISAIVERFGPRDGFRFCIRDGRGDGDDCQDELIRLALSARAGRVRWFSDRGSVDPGLAAAWGASMRHRFNCTAVFSWIDSGLSLTTHEGSGRGLRQYEVRYQEIGAGLRDLEVEDDEVAAFLTSGLNRGQSFDWVSVGHCDVGLTVGMAEELGGGRLLVPDYSGMLGVVGMISGPFVHEFHQSIEPREVDVNWVHDCLGRLMEQSAQAVMAEGCDLDNAESTRYVQLGEEGRPAVAVECGARLEIAGLMEGFERLRQRVGGRSRKRASVLVHGVGVRTVVEQPFMTVPPPSQAIAQGAISYDERRVKLLRLKGKKIAREELGMGTVLKGPSVILEPWHLTVVPAGWRAEAAMAGGILLRREEA